MCNGKGLEAVQRAGLSNRHTLLEEPNYYALPDLMRQGYKFDFIFIDGDHSFEFAFKHATKGWRNPCIS